MRGFSRVEFFRILNKNGFCAIPECSSIDLQGSGIVKSDLAIYTTSSENEQLLDCEYPFLVLEFKSYYKETTISQVQKYIDSLLPYYYGVVYGTRNSAGIEIYDRKNSKILSQSIPIGNPYSSDSDVLNLINNLPKVSTPKTPLNESYHISEVVEKSVKVSRFTPDLGMRYVIPDFSIHLDHRGVKYLGHDYSIIIDCPAKLTRLVFFDHNNNLLWCEFQNTRLVRCNIDVIAVIKYMKNFLFPILQVSLYMSRSSAIFCVAEMEIPYLFANLLTSFTQSEEQCSLSINII